MDQSLMAAGAYDEPFVASTSMKLFFNTRAKRNTAFMVLLAWLFALASGVANACLLEARQTHTHVAAIASDGAAAHAAVMVPGHAGAVADGVDASDLKAPCLKVCDEGSRSLPKQGSTLAQADPGPALLVLVLWSQAAPVMTALGHMDAGQPATPEPPIRVRFSRLAI